MNTRTITLIVFALFAFSISKAQNRTLIINTNAERNVQRFHPNNNRVFRQKVFRQNRRNRVLIRRTRPVQVVQVRSVDLVYDAYGNPFSVVNHISYQPVTRPIYQRPVYRRPVQRVYYNNPRRVCVQKRRY